MLISHFGWNGYIWRRRVSGRKVSGSSAADATGEHISVTAGGKGGARKALQGWQSQQHPGFAPPSKIAHLAGFAHELKTPLTIVSGYIELILDRTLGPLNENQEKALRNAEANCSRLKNFVQEFLSQAVLNAKQVKLYPELADLNKCIEDECNLWRQQEKARNRAIYFQQDPTIKPFFFDFDKIQQAVSNLIDNALKFTPSGGTVWLSSQHARMELNVGNNVVTGPGSERAGPSWVPAIKIVVADTGPGIPAEFCTEVFKEFFRIPGRTQQEGAGLGLTITARLVHAHGGRIWVESEPGAGARISFLIPVRHEPDSTDESF